MASGGGPAAGWLRGVLVALMLLPAAVASVAAAGAAEPTGVAELEAWFAARIDDERRAQGLTGLAVADDLLAVARRHSARMAGESRVFHNGGLPDEVAGWVALGENVGRGPTVEDLHASFVASPTHRGEILRPGFTAVGVGVVRAGDALWVTQVFRQSAVAPAAGERRSSSPSAPRRAPAAIRPAGAANTTTTTAATTTTSAAPPPAPPAPPLAVAAPLAAASAPAPGLPAVPPVGVVAAGLLWAVVAAATGVSALAGRALAPPPA